MTSPTAESVLAEVLHLTHAASIATCGRDNDLAEARDILDGLKGHPDAGKVAEAIRPCPPSVIEATHFHPGEVFDKTHWHVIEEREP